MDYEYTRLPEVIYIGCTSGQWPIVAFKNASHATGWLEDKEGCGAKRLYKVVINTAYEMELVPAVSSTIKTKEDGLVILKLCAETE